VAIFEPFPQQRSKQDEQPRGSQRNGKFDRPRKRFQPGPDETQRLDRSESGGSAGPITEEFESDRVGGKAAQVNEMLDTTRPDRAAMFGDSGPRTEEFDVDRVGGKEPDPNELLHTTRPDQDALLGDSGPRTEEFDIDRVGGAKPQPDVYDLSSDPNLETVQDLKDAVNVPNDELTPQDDEPVTDWDALMSPLNVNTEEFEVGQVGGRANEAEDEADDPWDMITRQLDDLTDDKDDPADK